MFFLSSIFTLNILYFDVQTNGAPPAVSAERQHDVGSRNADCQNHLSLKEGDKALAKYWEVSHSL